MDNNIEIGPEYLETMFKDPVFDKMLQAKIDANHRFRPVPGKDLRYKRTPWDYLNENGLLTPAKLKMCFVEILERNSKLSSGVRKLIQDIFFYTIQDYHKNQLRYGNKKESGDESTHNE